jgi:hypothetical protein
MQKPLDFQGFSGVFGAAGSCLRRLSIAVLSTTQPPLPDDRHGAAAVDPES